MVEHYLSLFMKAVFVENLALTFFSVCAPFGGFQERENGHGLGNRRDCGARHYRPMNNLLYQYLFCEGALATTLRDSRYASVDLSFLGLITTSA